MSIKATSDLWWKNAVVYCLDVKTFQDSDGDGCGDFVGLTERLDYLAGLGVTCVWLRPFYPSPDLDDGYDVANFYDVDPRVGSLGDFVEFVRTAEDRGIKVIADLVVNHTSTEHRWFQAARRDPASRFRDFYVWSVEPAQDVVDVVFPDVEQNNWEWDEQAQAYFLHSFYRHQPDLNVCNPAVRDEIHKVIGYWMQLGLSGFRVDAVPFLLLDAKLIGELMRDPHQVLRDMRGFLSRRRGDAILLGEVNLDPIKQLEYFGGGHGDELHMVFNFRLNQSLFLALARNDAGPLRIALEELPDPPEGNQWANFVRNHDELTLDQLTDAEQGDVYEAFAPQQDMRIFSRGIRRRVPSMLEGDRRRMEMVYSLMFSLPGTPVLLYGEEIGMGDNLDVPGRSSVRTPMQWSGEPNAGFTDKDVPTLVRPIVEDPQFGPKAVNVADQRRDPDSLLNWMERLIRRRKECPELGWGRCDLLEPDDPAVLAHRCTWFERTVVAVHNLAPQPRTVRLRVGGSEVAGVVDLLGDAAYQRVDAGTLHLELDAYGYRWLRVQRIGHPLYL